LLAAGASAEGRRVVAVGDVHGAVDAFRAILREVELVDEEDDWAGGDAILVQVGDFLDRGAESIRVARWLMELQRQAPEAGGRVIVLLGNHESMNLMGDLRYVPPEMLEPMVDKASDRRLARMCRERAAILRDAARTMNQNVPLASALRDRCMREHPEGLVEYQEALRPGETLGDWLRSLPAISKVEGTVFVHGGISPEMELRDLEEINRKVREELELFESWRRFLIEAGRMHPSATLVEMARAVQVELAAEKQAAEKTDGSAAGDPRGEDPGAEDPGLARFFDVSDSLPLSQKGPLWYRGYDSWTYEEGLEAMPEILESLGAERIVVGHTPQEPRRIRCRFGGRVFLIDTGMLAEYYDGVPSALEIRDGRVEAVYLDERVTLSGAAEGSPAAAVCR
jgi:hypothetical protein